jgi:hypothetical protein
MPGIDGNRGRWPTQHLAQGLMGALLHVPEAQTNAVEPIVHYPGVRHAEQILTGNG